MPVAAHVISAPQLTWRETAKVLPQMLRHGYDGAIARDGRRRGAVPTEQLLADYERWAPVRRGPATVTSVEPLVDVLVHTQDILRLLGRHHEMPVAELLMLLSGRPADVTGPRAPRPR